MAIAILAAAAAAAARADAQTPRGSSAELAGQIVISLDFEKERQIHTDPVPMYWHKVRRNGFPFYTTGYLTDDDSYSGRYSFKLQLNGGSVGYIYPPRKIPIRPDSDHLIEAYIKTEQLQYSRAELTCFLADRTGRTIVGTIRGSRLVGGPADNGKWQKVQILMPGGLPQARFLGIGVFILQGEQLQAEKNTSAYHINRQDIFGSAWFDAITVYRLPRLLLRTTSASNVFQFDQQPAVVIEVTGASRKAIKAELTVTSAEGKDLFRRSWQLQANPAYGEDGRKANPTGMRRFELPKLGPGFYHAQLKIFSGKNLITSRHISFAKLPRPRSEFIQRGRGFGVVDWQTPPALWPVCAELLRQIGVKTVKLPLWRASQSEESQLYNDPAFDRMLAALNRRKIDVVATLAEPPSALIHPRSSGNGLLELFGQDAKLWRPYLADLLARYWGHVRWWQFGPDGDSRWVWDGRLDAVSTKVHREFSRLAAWPQLIIPWDAQFELRNRSVSAETISVNVHPSIAPQAVPQYLNEIASETNRPIWAVIYPQPRERYRRQQRLEDFVLRLAYAHASPAEQIFIHRPWRDLRSPGTMSQTDRRIEPRELLVVYSNIADLLGGTTYAGTLTLAPGVKGLIFSAGRKAAMLVHRGTDDCTTDERFRLLLGEQTKAYDIWGRQIPIENDGGLVSFELGSSPLLLHNVDARLARLQASMDIAPSVIPASYELHEAKIRFVNSFQVPVSGRIRLLAPDGWEISPSAAPFSLQPQQRFELPIQLRPRYSTLAGVKSIKLRISLDADQTYRFTGRVFFTLAMKDIDFRVIARRKGGQLRIVQTVSNFSDKPVSFFAFLVVPGRARQERVISMLQPGGTVSKSFLVDNAEQLIGKQLRTGLREVKGPRLINVAVHVD